MAQNIVKDIDRSLDVQEKDQKFLEDMQKECKGNIDMGDYILSSFPVATSQGGLSTKMKIPQKSNQRDMNGRYKNQKMGQPSMDLESLGKGNRSIS